MANIRTLKLNLLADVSGFNKELEAAQGKMGAFQDKVKKAGRVASLALGGLAAAGFGAVKAAEEVAVANARLDNILTEMGYPQATERVKDYAAALELTTAVDGEVIKLTQAKLATFKNLTATVNTAGGAFDRATVAALDMAAAGFGTAEGNAVQLGKALEDPIKGITALRKSGITFTEDQQNLIKSLMESNDVLGAQEIILAAVEGQVGGTAEATATDSAKMKLALENVVEAIGKGLLPMFKNLSDFVLRFTPVLEANASKFLIVAGVIAAVAVSVKVLQIGMAAFNAIILITNGLVAAFNFVLALNPIGLVVIAIGLLVAALVIAYNKFEPFRDLVDNLFDVMKKFGAFIVNTLVGQFQRFLDIINKVKDGVKAIVDGIGNSTIGKAIGGIIGSGRLPGMASGGSVMGGQAVRVGEFGSEIFVPSGSGSIRPDRGGGGNTFILNGIVDAESARRSIERVLQDSARRTGAINLNGATL